MSGEGEVYRQPGALAGQVVRQADAPDQSFSRTQENAPSGGPAKVDYDPEDVQFAARVDVGDVVMYLPEITYLDTQPWSVEIGLTPDRLVQLRDAIDNHLRGAAGNAGPANCGDTPTVVGLQPTTVGQQPTVVAQQATTGDDRPYPGRSVVTQTDTTVVHRSTVATPSDGVATSSVPSGNSVVAQQATVADEVEQLRSVVARCQGLADWLARHASLGVDIEADSIRRAIGGRLRAALDPSARPAEWEAQ